MEQDRFDQLAKKVFEGSSRRRVIGGAIASVVGAGVAAVTGASAKNDKAKGKAKTQGKKGNGKAKGEFVCNAANANQVACTTVAVAGNAQAQAAQCAAVGCGAPVPATGGLCTGAGFTNATAGNACPPGSCCADTPAGSGPACVPIGAQGGGTVCGNPTAATGPGTGVCRTCPTGTRCSGAPLFRCVCDPTTCGNGCCVRGGANAGNDDQCVVNGTGTLLNSSNPQFNGASVCGSGGGTCNICSTGGLNFRGCCGATGTCEQGTSTPNCGTNGNVCTNCSTTNASSTCVAQACTVVTTTAAPTTAAPTTAAPTTTIAPCAAGTVRCGTAVPAVCCKKCNGKNTGCKKKRRKKN